MREKASTRLAGFGKASVAQVALASPTHIRDGIMQWRVQLRLSLTNTFYEKVVIVKADVAAILKFFLPLDPADLGRPSRRGPGSAHRGEAQGGGSGAL